MKRRWKGQFVKPGKAARLEALSESKRAAKNDENDEEYEEIRSDSTSSCSIEEKEIPSAQACSSLDPDWSSGRRIIELGHVANQLKQCKNRDCEKPLLLHNIDRETTVGYTSILYIKCSCGMSNAITTGKSHRPPDKSKRGMPVFDINTKSTLGVIHNGLTYRQMKGLMSTLEVGGLHHTGMMRRREEITPIILGVARDSCSDTLSEDFYFSCWNSLISK